jgi:hypothetical protein
MYGARTDLPLPEGAIAGADPRLSRPSRPLGSAPRPSRSSRHPHMFSDYSTGVQNAKRIGGDNQLD